MAPKENSFVLPVGIASRVEAGRVLREIQVLDEFLSQAAIRHPGSSTKLPRTSRLLDDLVTSNKLNILLEPDRRQLQVSMTTIKDKAPLLHISFSADPSPLFTQKLVTWLRQNIHPYVLLQMGLQPNIGAGCIVRTNNRYFDFSLRQHFKDQRELLIRELAGV